MATVAFVISPANINVGFERDSAAGIAGFVKLCVEEAASGFTIRPIGAFNRRAGVAL
jgi:hypothetical protein